MSNSDGTNTESNQSHLEDGDANFILANGNNNAYDNSVTDGSHDENSIPMITPDLDNNDDEPSKVEKNWAELPTIPIENIYSFISRTDQSRMSQVCSRWADCFDSPCVWKTIQFYLPEHVYSEEIYPEVRFARKYGSMFRHVEIICKRLKSHLIDVIAEQLKFFLEAMASSSQLNSIKFINMRKYFRKLNETTFENVFRAVISFFNTQKNLKTVVFQDSRFSQEDTVALLKAIFHSNSTTIRNLTLQGFEREATTTELNHEYTSNLREVCCRIMKVESLEVDYSHSLEDLINNLHDIISSPNYQLDKNEPSIKTLTIFCEGKGLNEFRGVLPETWEYLSRVFPGLSVKMDITIHRNLAHNMDIFLVKNLPLKTLDLRFRKLSDSPMFDISVLFTHLRICKHYNHLEVLNVMWLPFIADYAGSVVPFVQSCKKLKTLHLHTERTPAGIANVLQALFENRPMPLKSITLWFENLREVDNLTEVSEAYYSLFKSRGIDFFLVVDRGTRARR